MKVFLALVVWSLICSGIQSRKKLRFPHREVLKVPIKKVKVNPVTKAAKQGFIQGVNFVKRQLDQETSTSTTATSGLPAFDDKTIATLGLGGLGVGLFDQMLKKRKADNIQDHVENNFAFKDSIINLIGKEMTQLQFTNKNLERVAERVSDVETQLTNILQEKIFEAYRKRRERKAKQDSDEMEEEEGKHKKRH